MRINGKASPHMLDELDDVVQGKPRFQIAKITGCYLERLPSGSAAPADQPQRNVSFTILRNGRPERRDSALSFAATSSSKVSVVRVA
jgi:hypothetical protein